MTPAEQESLIALVTHVRDVPAVERERFAISVRDQSAGPSMTLEALWRRLPDLDPDARDAIDGMSEHLANRLLRGPLERLGRDADGRNERAMRELFGL